jgi:NAD(P)-dependent dehydrogenase (short-subunit alcohol dehydrogenase family)
MKKTALITGGSRGIGYGIAVELAKAGFDLAINGTRDQSLVGEELAKLKEYGGDVIYIQGDISLRTDRERMVNEVLSHYGHLNFLINNAGMAPRERKDILEASEESFDQVMTTNLKGPYFLTQLISRHMIALKKENPGLFCCIINISSISASIASVNRGEYCISKAGISMATKLWAARLGEYDIPVYEIQPGVIKTDMTAGVQEKYDSLFKNGLAVQQRWGLPEDVGKAALSMCLGSLPYSTGQVIMVDGGMTIPRL